jgi:hypothetical protein
MWNMSPSSFDTLADENPELRYAFARVRDWAQQHPASPILDPRVLHRDLRDVDAVALSFTLHLLVRDGLFERVYMAVTPSGVLADGEYSNPNEVPEWVPDRFNNYFEITDGDIVPVLKPAVKDERV